MRKPKEIAKPSADLERYFRKANVRVEELNNAKSQHAKSILIGRFLSPLVDREVTIRAKGRTGKAVLKSIPARAGQKLLYAEVHWDDDADEGTDATAKKQTPVNDAKTKIPIKKKSRVPVEQKKPKPAAAVAKKPTPTPARTPKTPGKSGAIDPPPSK